MVKNSSRIIRYETVVQLLLVAALVLSPFLAFNFMDLELFSVSKTFWSSMKPWLSPSYVCLFINFIIFFIAASSSICSKAKVIDPSSSPTDSCIESSIVCDSFEAGSLPYDDYHDHGHLKFRTLEETFNDRNGGVGRLKVVAPESIAGQKDRHSGEKEVAQESMAGQRGRQGGERILEVVAPESMVYQGGRHGGEGRLKVVVPESIAGQRGRQGGEKVLKVVAAESMVDKRGRHGGEGRLKVVAPESMAGQRSQHGGERIIKEVAPESVVDMRELRKSKTFNGGELRTSGRRERYVRILSQDELDRRVEAFIYKFKRNENGIR